MIVRARIVGKKKWVLADHDGGVHWGRYRESLAELEERVGIAGADLEIRCGERELAAALTAAFSRPGAARAEGGRKPHVSASQLDLYCRCGEAYRRRYLDGERIPPPFAILRGTAIHRAAARNFAQKRDSRQDLPAGEIVEAAVAAFGAELDAQGVTLTAEESARSGAAIGEARDTVAALAEAHANTQAPDYMPVLVEETVRIELPAASRDLLGVVDLLDDRGRVVDFKNVRKKPSQAEADASTQLTVYASAATTIAAGGVVPSETRLDALVVGAKGIRREVVASARDRQDFAALANRINTVTDAIEKGIFAPATPGAWWCSAKWCGYFATCRFVNPNRGGASDE